MPGQVWAYFTLAITHHFVPSPRRSLGCKLCHVFLYRFSLCLLTEPVAENIILARVTLFKSQFICTACIIEHRRGSAVMMMLVMSWHPHRMTRLGPDAHGATPSCHLDWCPSHLPLLLNTKGALAKMNYISWKTHLVSHLPTFSIFVDKWIAILKVPHMRKWHLPQEFDNEFERKVESAYKFFATAFIKPGTFCVQMGPHAVRESQHI